MGTCSWRLCTFRNKCPHLRQSCYYCIVASLNVHFMGFFLSATVYTRHLFLCHYLYRCCNSQAPYHEDYALRMYANVTIVCTVRQRPACMWQRDSVTVYFQWCDVPVSITWPWRYYIRKDVKHLAESWSLYQVSLSTAEISLKPSTTPQLDHRCPCHCTRAPWPWPPTLDPAPALPHRAPRCLDYSPNHKVPRFFRQRLTEKQV